MEDEKLYMICGGCGCNNAFTYKIIDCIDTMSKDEYQRVSIKCENCGAIHRLEDYAK